jgi:glycosyltransferase involved in cell wall biosynthesis
MTRISVLILTKNEQQDLPGCLASVSWSDDVHVLDSFSTDQTVSVAEQAGAKVTQRVFDGYAKQRNAGLALPFKHPWLLILDADERMPAATGAEMNTALATVPQSVSAFSIRRRDIWWGRWLKHAQISPFYVRLVRVGKVHYEREINEVLCVQGDTLVLTQHFDHHPFSKGLAHWVEKHNKYSTMEAELIANGGVIQPCWREALFGDDFHTRRLHQKAIFYRLPGRPFLKLGYMLVARRAFLDGWPGVRYAILQSIYEYLIVLKTREMQESRP